MPYLNVKQRVLECKVVYYGAGLSGKTTNLEMIRERSKDGRCGDLMSLNTDGDRTLFFDWLPFNLGQIKGCDVKVQLYTVPGQAKYIETRRRVLKDADGIVLVLDSQSGALEKNRQIAKEMLEHIEEFNLQRAPLLVQLNKRDLPTAMKADELLKACGLYGRPWVEAVASEGKGVFETLKRISGSVFSAVQDEAKESAEAIQTGEHSSLDGNTLYAELQATGSQPAPDSLGHAQAAHGVARSVVASAAGVSTSSVSTNRASPGGVDSRRGEVRQLRPAGNESVGQDAKSKEQSANHGNSPANPLTPNGNTVRGEIVTGPSKLQLERLEALLAKLEESVASSSATQMRDLAAAQRELARRVANVEKTFAQSSRELRAMVEQVDVPGQLGKLTDVIASSIDLERIDASITEQTTALKSGFATLDTESERKLATAEERIAERVASQLDALAENVCERIQSTLESSVQRLTSDLEARLDEISPHFESLEGALQKASELTVATVAESEGNVIGTLDGILQAIHQTRQGIDSLGKTSSGLRLELDGASKQFGERQDVTDKKIVALTSAHRSLSEKYARIESKASQIEKIVRPHGEQLSQLICRGEEVKASIDGLGQAQVQVLRGVETSVKEQRRYGTLFTGLQSRIESIGSTLSGQINDSSADLRGAISSLLTNQFRSQQEYVSSLAEETNRRQANAETLLSRVATENRNIVETLNSKKTWFRG